MDEPRVFIHSSLFSEAFTGYCGSNCDIEGKSSQKRCEG